MRRNHVYTPDGVKVVVDLEDPLLMERMEAQLIEPYRSLIESSWLEGSKKSGQASMEERVKKYLERLGTMLLQDPGDYVILTESMQKRIAQRETELADYLEAKPQMRTKRVYQKRCTQVPRSQKLRHIQQQFPKASIEWCRVDTENVFVSGEVTYRISHPDYLPQKLSGDIYYPMDRVACVRWNGAHRFYTQGLDPIPDHQIIRLAIPGCGAENRTEE